MSNELQAIRIMPLVSGTTQVTNATTANVVDTWDANSLPFSRAMFYIDHPAAEATNSSAQWTGLRFTHGATTNASSASAISGLTGTTNATATATQFRLPQHNDTSNRAAIIASIDVDPLERYLFIESTSAEDYNTHVAYCILYGGKNPQGVPSQVGKDMIADSTVLGAGVTTFIRG